jgi:tetratricopeptide (TPR) repeat protein
MLENIGEGGMGVVWRSFDLDLEEPVAIKFLRKDLAQDDETRAWFRREVKLARRVTHPNVARVFEFGRDGDTYFLTMEFVRGESLQAALQRDGRLPVAAVRRLAIGLCRGLAAAHAAGVVHGDIKPANILLTPDRGAVLTDFGIARVLSEVQHAPHQSWGGTPIYMAPEQLTGGALDLRCDVYAVGAVLYEALTGTMPWPTDHITSLVDAKCTTDLDWRRLAPELSIPWRALLADCLRRDPRRRPEDARALLARLAALPGAPPGEPPEADDLWGADPTVEEPTLVERMPSLAAAATTSPSPTTEPPAPTGDERGMDDETAFLYARAREACRGMQVDAALRCYESALARQPGNHRLQLGYALARVKLVSLRRAGPGELTELRRLAAEAAGPDPEAHLLRGALLHTLGEPAAAASALATALRGAPNLVPALALVGDMLGEVGRLEEAERRLHVAAALDRHDALTAVTRARLLARQGRWEEFYTLTRGTLAELHFRTVHVARLMLQRPTRGELERLAGDLADNRDGLPGALWQDVRDVVAFALGHDDRRPAFDRLSAAYDGAIPSRQSSEVALALCEMACVLGELGRAGDYLALADAQQLFDLHWLERCPTIEPLRGEPWFPQLHARVRARAQQVAEALVGRP